MFRRLLELIRTLRMIDIPWDLIKKLDWDLLISLFDVPELEDEEAFRGWCRDLVSVGQTLAGETPTPLDDELLRIFAVVVDTEMAWRPFYRLIKATISDPVVLDELEEREGEALGALRGEVAPRFDPSVLVTIITMIVQIIQAFRTGKEESNGH